MRLSSRPRSAALVLSAAVAVAVLPALQVSAAPSTSWKEVGQSAKGVVKGVPGDGHHTVVRPVDRSRRRLASGSLHKGQHAATPHVLSATPLSDIQVNYDSNFNANPAAITAFDAAVAIWEHAVASTVPIEVDASMATLDPGVLGGARPIDFYIPSNEDIGYPVALANALSGTDLNGTGTSEIDAQFPIDTSLFYFGTDGNTPSDKYDFESIVLHELGHGLGFVGSVDQSTSGPASYSNPPLVYDAFTETGDGTPILNYPNNSAALTAAATSDSLYWGGPLGSGADHGREPRLYAPSTGFEPGSSYSHLDDTSYPQNDPDSLMTPTVDTGEAIHDPGEIMLGMFRDMGWVTPGLPGSKFTAIAPVRLLDTGKTHLVRGDATVDIPVTGSHGVPSNATAVVVNLTSSTPTSDNVLRAYPLSRASGAPVPTVSNVNTARRDTRANLATVSIGKGGRIRLLTTGGATRLVVDLDGYYAPTATSYFHPRAPARIMDTRAGIGPVPQSKVGPGRTIDLQVTGKNGVPSGATAVVMTLTAVAPTITTYVTAYPSDGSPGTSNINVDRGAVVANQVVVKLSSLGKVRFRNNTGAVDLLGDLSGWFDGDVSGALFRPALAVRVKDSRPAKLGRGVASDVGISELANAFWGVPTTATTAVVNLTGVKPTTATYLTLTPASPGTPGVSNLNLAAGQTAAASATVRLGSGKVRVRNSAGSVSFILDLQGWYGPA